MLVVDDAPMIVKMTSMLLTRKGHTVQHAVNSAYPTTATPARIATD